MHGSYQMIDGVIYKEIPVIFMFNFQTLKYKGLCDHMYIYAYVSSLLHKDKYTRWMGPNYVINNKYKCVCDFK